MKKITHYKGYGIYSDDEGNIGVGVKLGKDNFEVFPLTLKGEQNERPMTASDLMNNKEHPDNWKQATKDLRDSLKAKHLTI